MKKSFLSCMTLVAVLFGSMSLNATNYCHEQLTNGDNSIYLSAIKVADGQYQIKIEADVEMVGLGGSFCYVNGEAGYILNGDHSVISADKKTITVDIVSNQEPQLYTPLYVLMPGEIAFAWPNDVVYSDCAGSGEGGEQGNDDPQYEIVKTEVFVPANASVVRSWFANANWEEETDSKATYDAAKGELTVDIAVAKTQEWQAQVFLTTGVKLVAGEKYDVAFTLTASTPLMATFKYGKNGQDVEIKYDNSLTLEANTPKQVEYTDLVGNAAADDFIFDFGRGSVAGTKIVVSNISIKLQEKKQISAIEEIVAPVKVQKIMENGVIYIIRDGVKYNVMGAQVK